MVKKQEPVTEDEKGASASPKGSRRVLQVVEIADGEEANISPKKVPTEEKPLPASPMLNMLSDEEDVSPAVHESPHEAPFDLKHEDKPPTAEKQKEVVSGLFKNRDGSVGYPDIAVHKKGFPVSVLLWVIGLFVVIGGIAVLLLTMKNGSLSLPQGIASPVTVNAAPTTTPTIEVTPTPGVDKKNIRVQILNGSGKSGVASTMKKALEEKGYTVTGTGNAKSFDYEQTVILVKKENPSYLNLLKDDLSTLYSLGTMSADLATTASIDAQVIIGKE